MNPMKASELMEQLKTRLPDAPVYATEGRDLTIITFGQAERASV
jgi:hypothetical protein